MISSHLHRAATSLVRHTGLLQFNVLWGIFGYFLFKIWQQMKITKKMMIKTEYKYAETRQWSPDFVLSKAGVCVGELSWRRASRKMTGGHLRKCVCAVKVLWTWQVPVRWQHHHSLWLLSAVRTLAVPGRQLPGTNSKSRPQMRRVQIVSASS